MTAALLTISVALTVWSTIGAIRVRDPLARLHYMTLVSTVATFAMTLAVIVSGQGTSAMIKAGLVFVVTAITSPASQQMIGRALWVRRHGGWQLPPDGDA